MPFAPAVSTLTVREIAPVRVLATISLIVKKETT